MRLNINKMCVISYSRKTNVLRYDYRLGDSVIERISSIKDLGVFFVSKLYFHNHVDFLFSKCIKLLGLIRSITFSFTSLDCLFVLYTALVRPRLEYASVVWNSITATDSKKLERIQQKFTSVCFYRISPCLAYSYKFALAKLNLPSLCKRRHHLDALFHTSLSWSQILPFGNCLPLCSSSSRLGLLHIQCMSLKQTLPFYSMCQCRQCSGEISRHIYCSSCFLTLNAATCT
jgi:hypothetical protein